MSRSNMDIEFKRTMFKSLVTAWSMGSDGIFKMSEQSLIIDEKTGKEPGEFENILCEQRMEFEGTFLDLVCQLMEVEKSSSDILNDDWFWAEWDATDNCFWFVYGLTAPAREDFLVNKFNREQDEKEK